MDHLPNLVAEARDAIDAAQDIPALDEVRVRYLGKKGEITALLKGLGKLPPEEIRTLTEWIRAGAAWPVGGDTVDPSAPFDLDARRKSHWAWQPVKVVEPRPLPEGTPEKLISWATSPVDQYVLEQLLARKLAPAADADKVTTLFIQENARRGLILSTGFFFNCAHDEAALAKTEEVVGESFAVIAEGLAQGRLDELLECEIQEDLFRRLVR